MPNQYESRVSTYILKEYLDRGKKAGEIRGYVAQIEAVPGLCLMPKGASSLFIRAEGRLHKLPIRSLVYYAMYGKSPLFWQCSCDNKGCVNPRHQRGKGL